MCRLSSENPLHTYPIEETGYNKFFEYCVRNSKVYLNTNVKKDLELRQNIFLNRSIILSI